MTKEQIEEHIRKSLNRDFLHTPNTEQTRELIRRHVTQMLHELAPEFLLGVEVDVQMSDDRTVANVVFYEKKN